MVTLTEATEEATAKDDEIQVISKTQKFRLCLLLMVTDFQHNRESQLLHYYQWWCTENLVNLSVVQANSHVYVVFLAFKCKPGELYATHKPNEKYLLTLA